MSAGPVDPCRLGAAEAARRIAAGELSSAALVAACLERISEREGTVRAWAKLLKEKEVVGLLQQTLDEEGRTDKLLTKLATSSVNFEAADGEGEDE